MTPNLTAPLQARESFRRDLRPKLRLRRALHTLLLVAAIPAGPGLAVAQPAQQPLVRASPELAAVDLRAADMRFLLQAVASGVTEVRAGRIALERSRDSAVRAYARRLVRDHEEANARLLQIAREKEVVVPREPSGSQKGMLDALRGVAVRDFDQQFLERAGVRAHREAVALFHANLLRPDPDPALAQFAQSTLPVLEEHLRMAQAALARSEGVARRPG